MPRHLVVPTLMTLVMLAALIGLGTWQVYRLHWKEGVLARIAAAEIAPPEPLTSDPAPYTKISVTGRFQYDRAAELGAEVRDTLTGPVMGSYQIVPLARDNARTILVNRGWLPQTRIRPLDEPAGEVTVAGYMRPGDTASWFSAPDDPATRRFYTMDPSKIGAAVGIADPAPYTLVVLGPARPDIYPAPSQHLPRPPNNHLSYIITWYGLAAALVVIFAVWVRKGIRGHDPSFRL